MTEHTAAAPASPARASPAAATVLVIAACSLVYGAWLGAGGFTLTEGHRAVPGFTMLETGDWIVPRMFEADYVRKPPGMPWAIGASAAVFGETEVAARLVSAVAATLLALASAWFAGRWFGARAALPAGLAAALMPWMWAFGRSAEIEALNQLGTGLAALATVDLLVRRDARGRVRVITALGIGMAVMLFAKGPAGIAVPLACVAASVWATRRWRAAVSAQWWLATGAALAAFGAWAWLAAAAAADDALTQSPGDFLWSAPLLDVALLAPASFVSAMPAALALLFPWGPDARAEARRAPGGRRRLRIARALAAAWLLTLAALVALGMGNPRYTLPAAVLCPPLVGYVAWLWSGPMTAKRRTIARIMTLGHPLVLVGVLAAAFPAFVRWYEMPVRGGSGRDAGVALAAGLPEDTRTVVAGSVINTRPEVLWYLRRAAENAGRPMGVRWIPGVDPASELDAHTVGVVWRRSLDGDRRGGIEVLARHAVAGREAVLVRVIPATSSDAR